MVALTVLPNVSSRSIVHKKNQIRILHFFRECAIKEPNEHAQNEEAAEQLYKASMYWTGLKKGMQENTDQEEDTATVEES